MKNVRVASLFAGVGGICSAFKQAGANMVWANEIDKNACMTYRENFGDDYLVEGDIHLIETKDIPDFDILTSGFPCQAFSIAGYRKGFEDDRGHLFFQTLRIIVDKKPKAFLIENVKNLVSHDDGKTFKIMTDALEDVGYHIDKRVYNALEYGNLPQNRERIYVVGFKNENDLKRFIWPTPIELELKISDIIDFNDKKEDRFYYKTDSQYYEMLNEAVVSQDTIYQLRRIYVRENKSNVCPTLTANMGTGGHNVPIIRDNYGLRKLTPRECFLFQGFNKDFKFPLKASAGQLYKQAGNSVPVPVVARIAEQMIKVL